MPSVPDTRSRPLCPSRSVCRWTRPERTRATCVPDRAVESGVSRLLGRTEQQTELPDSRSQAVRLELLSSQSWSWTGGGSSEAHTRALFRLCSVRRRSTPRNNANQRVAKSQLRNIAADVPANARGSSSTPTSEGKPRGFGRRLLRLRKRFR
jgi:hypothetical protein